MWRYATLYEHWQALVTWECHCSGVDGPHIDLDGRTTNLYLYCTVVSNYLDTTFMNNVFVRVTLAPIVYQNCMNLINRLSSVNQIHL